MELNSLNVAALIAMEKVESDVEKAVIAVACCTGKTHEEVMQMDAGEFTKLSGEVMASFNNEKKS